MAQHYTPEEVSGAVLATELATDLANRGHQVTFVTCAPNYPQGKVFSGYKNKIYATEMLNRVKVIRTWSYISPSKAFGPRLLNYGSFSATALYGGLLTAKPDVIFSYSPPLPLGLSAWLLSRRRRVPWVLRVEDLYPEAAIAAGVLRNAPAIKLLAGLERFVYQRANHISVISESFRQNLLGKEVPANKLSVTPVWADPDTVRPLPRHNGFREKYGLNGQFVVLYAGNLGHAAALDEVIEAAELLQKQADIQFLFIGEGVKKELLIEQAEAKDLSNVTFLPFQPREVFPEMLAAADVSLVTLQPKASGTSLPSKAFNIMASGRPILGVSDPTSEVAQLVQEGQCGVNVAPGNAHLLAEAITTLKQEPDRLNLMGHNGRKQLETRYSRNHCVNQFEELLKNLVRSP